VERTILKLGLSHGQVVGKEDRLSEPATQIVGGHERINKRSMLGHGIDMSTWRSLR